MTHIPYETVIEKLRGRHVMLVGGAGFIGHNLALELRRQGIETSVVDNLMVNSLVDNAFHDRGQLTKRKLNLHFLSERIEMMRDAGVIFRNVDARHYPDIAQVIAELKPTNIVHLSAIASAVDARINPGLMFDLQLVTLRNIIEIVRQHYKDRTQLTLLSSSTVYGDFETPTVDESTRPRPRGIYANTKYMAERLLRDYSFQYGLGIIILRPSALYGERCVSRRVSQAFIENALMDKPLILEGGGDGRLDFTYIEDLVEGMIRAMALSGVPGTSSTFNMTFGNSRSIAELAAVVKELVPEAKLVDAPRALDKPVRGTLSMARANQVLGFYPSWTLEKGYRKYCEWYLDQYRHVVGRNA